MDPFGFTRASVQSDHALITSDTHVSSPRLGWNEATAVVHISPAMGARFTQFTATLDRGGSSDSPPPGVERFVYVQQGQVELEFDSVSPTSIGAGGYAWLPCDEPHELRAQDAAKLLVFEKDYQPLAEVPTPDAVIGDENHVQAEPFMGDEDARLKTLLPVEPRFDMAVNVFTYQPGATLPQVEIHVMEHGLLMLQGAGVYRLGDRWYPVQAGDVIWIASYCPQWFVAMGKTPARYIYYKDIHRDPLDA